MPDTPLQTAIKAEAVAQAAFFAATDRVMKAQKEAADANAVLGKTQAAYAAATALRISLGG